MNILYTKVFKIYLEQKYIQLRSDFIRLWNEN